MGAQNNQQIRTEQNKYNYLINQLIQNIIKTIKEEFQTLPVKIFIVHNLKKCHFSNFLLQVGCSMFDKCLFHWGSHFQTTLQSTIHLTKIRCLVPVSCLWKNFLSIQPNTMLFCQAVSSQCFKLCTQDFNYTIRHTRAIDLDSISPNMPIHHLYSTGHLALAFYFYTTSQNTCPPLHSKMCQIHASYCFICNPSICLCYIAMSHKKQSIVYLFCQGLPQSSPSFYHQQFLVTSLSGWNLIYQLMGLLNFQCDPQKMFYQKDCYRLFLALIFGGLIHPSIDSQEQVHHSLDCFLDLISLEGMEQYYSGLIE